MKPFPTILALIAGDPAVGLVPSLVLAAVGVAIVVIVVVKVMGESEKDHDETGGDKDAEHSSEDVV
jgi:hypothetical protein